MASGKRIIARRRSHLLVYSYGDYDEEALRSLRRLLSVWEEEANGGRYMTFRAELRDVDPEGRKVLRIPRWTDESVVAAAFPRHAWVDAERPWTYGEIEVGFKSGQYPYRDRDQARITEFLQRDGPGARLVVAATAAGKSYCAIRAWASRPKSNVMLGIFAQHAHLQNFQSELLKFTDLGPEDILVIDSGRKKIQKTMSLLSGPAKLPWPPYKAILMLHRTAWNCLEGPIDFENGVVLSPNELSDFVQRMGVGTIVSDECHLEFRSVAALSLVLNVGLTIFLTATAARTNWKEDRVLRQVLPMSSALYVRKEARLKVRRVKFDSGPDAEDVVSCTDRRRDIVDVNAYFDYLSLPSRFARWWGMVRALAERCFREGATGVAIVVSGKLEFLDAVLNQAAEDFPSKTVGNFSSRIKNLGRRMEELDKDVVVTTEKSFGGSVNPPRTSHMICAAPIASPVWVEQISGRLRGQGGMACVLFDIWDAGFPKLADQAKRRKTTQKKIALEVTEEEADF